MKLMDAKVREFNWKPMAHLNRTMVAGLVPNCDPQSFVLLWSDLG